MIIKRLNRDFKIIDRYLIAHKGIYGKFFNEEIMPNSYDSCCIAIDNAIPFECDVRNTKDNIPILAHDSFFMYKNKKIKINKYSYIELCNIVGKENITTLKSVLEYNNGRVGIVIDAKEAHIFYSEYRRNLVSLLNKYSSKGEILLQSFNPFFMLSVRKHLQGVLTGQLICRARTILDSFKAPKTFAYIYERLISLICFIARTDIINMENSEDVKWRRRAKHFTYKKIKDKVNYAIYNADRFVDKIQYKIVKFTSEITKKPVITFTIKKDKDFKKMENEHIANYIVDFSHKGVIQYIMKIKALSKQDNRLNG